MKIQAVRFLYTLLHDDNTEPRDIPEGINPLALEMDI